MNHPIDRIQWVPTSLLKANDYNPNVVFDAELKLLERSILRTGWVQPVLVSEDWEIVDGFHRWWLASNSKQIRDRDEGRVPVSVLAVDRPHAMLLTVRMNRAKGSHVALRMHDLVVKLVNEHHLEREEIAAEIGATLAEVDLLYQEGVFSARKTERWKYSRAWVPEEREADASRG